MKDLLHLIGPPVGRVTRGLSVFRSSDSSHVTVWQDVLMDSRTGIDFLILGSANVPPPPSPSSNPSPPLLPLHLLLPSPFLTTGAFPLI